MIHFPKIKLDLLNVFVKPCPLERGSSIGITIMNSDFERNRKKMETLLKDKGSTYILEKCDNKELDINFGSDYWLLLAVKNNDIEFAKELLKRDINIVIDCANIREKYTRNPLYLAVMKNKQDFVNLLLPYYFQWGTKKENNERFKYWQKDHEYSKSYLDDYATLFSIYGNEKALNYLINFDPQILERVSSETIIDNGLKWGRANGKYFEMLIKHGVILSNFSSKMWADSCERGNVKIIEYLLKDKKLNQPLLPKAYFTRAAKTSNVKVLEMIDKYTTEMPIDFQESMLIRAIESEAPKNIHFLINKIHKTMDVNQKELIFEKVFPEAIKTESLEIINIFIPLLKTEYLKTIQKSAGIPLEILSLINHKILHEELNHNKIVKGRNKI